MGSILRQCIWRWLGVTSDLRHIGQLNRAFSIHGRHNLVRHEPHVLFVSRAMLRETLLLVANCIVDQKNFKENGIQQLGVRAYGWADATLQQREACCPARRGQRR